MIDCFLEKGFQYFDTAWYYHNGQSEAAVKECLVKRYPRSAFLLADQVPLILIRKESELEEYFNTQIVRCGVDYFDYYLIHDMGGNRRKAEEDTHIFEFLPGKKKAGLVGGGAIRMYFHFMGLSHNTYLFRGLSISLIYLFFLFQPYSYKLIKNLFHQVSKHHQNQNIQPLSYWPPTINITICSFYYSKNLPIKQL